MLTKTIEGTVDFIGNATSTSTGDGPSINLYSALRIGGTELRRVQIRHEFANFHVGDRVRLLYTSPLWNQYSLNGPKHFAIGLETPHGKFKGEPAQMFGEMAVGLIVGGLGNALVALILGLGASFAFGRTTQSVIACTGAIWLLLMGRMALRYARLYRAVSAF